MKFTDLHAEICPPLTFSPYINRPVFMLEGLNTRGLIRLDELSVSKHKNGHSLLLNTAKKHATTRRIGARSKSAPAW